MLPIFVLFFALVLLVFMGIKIVPHQHAYIVEKLGRFDRKLDSGMNFLIPFVEREFRVQRVIRLELFGDEIETILEVDPLRGEVLGELEKTTVYPAGHYVTPAERMQRAIEGIEDELEQRLADLARDGKLVEKQRLEQRTRYDLELMRATGVCPGIENYSRWMDGRAAGEAPFTLLNYFPEDFLVVVDESHVAVPQVGGMFKGDRSRKSTLVEYGFRLPSALDNRPLRFEEWERLVRQVVYVSATPSVYELERSQGRYAEAVEHYERARALSPSDYIIEGNLAATLFLIPGRDAEARHAVQEALVRAWQQLPSLRDPDRFDAWLYRLVVNACADQGRQLRRLSNQVRPLPMNHSISDDTGAVADREQLEVGFSRLKPEQRAVVVLHYYNGFSASEIAHILGIPEGTARSRLFYATEAMRAALEADARRPGVAKDRTA